jgi:large subunit ribosomal protein L40e
MAKYDIAVKRNLEKKICYDCNSRNAMTAESCRKCGNKNLRKKAKESRST